MTSIERNFNGTVYRVSVREEERGMRMIEGEEEGAILQDPRVTEVVLEETCPRGHRPNSLETPMVKVVSLEVMVGQDRGRFRRQPTGARGVLLQRWHQEGGEGGAQVVKNKFDNDDLKR